ncbi:hypothetical protein CRENBAI_007648 [Crenichthys baileyi]|uniref:Uncharacterized protein n=1 Tax=Crenichthys baileyi TaxID=28760 RepID=A0AAV9SLD9_9TELE
MEEKDEVKGRGTTKAEDKEKNEGNTSTGKRMGMMMRMVIEMMTMLIGDCDVNSDDHEDDEEEEEKVNDNREDHGIGSSWDCGVDVDHHDTEDVGERQSNAKRLAKEQGEEEEEEGADDVQVKEEEEEEEEEKQPEEEEDKDEEAEQDDEKGEQDEKDIEEEEEEEEDESQHTKETVAPGYLSRDGKIQWYPHPCLRQQQGQQRRQEQQTPTSTPRSHESSAFTSQVNHEWHGSQGMTTVIIKITDGQIHLSPDLLAVMVEFGVKPELTSPEVPYLAAMFYTTKKKNLLSLSGAKWEHNDPYQWPYMLSD